MATAQLVVRRYTPRRSKAGERWYNVAVITYITTTVHVFNYREVWNGNPARQAEPRP